MMTITRCKVIACLRQVKYLLIGAMSVFGFLVNINTAVAAEYEPKNFMVCNWEGLQDKYIRLQNGSFQDVLRNVIERRSEAYNCDGEGNCSYRYYWYIPNRTYTITAAVAVRCINVGDAAGPVRFSFYKSTDQKPTYYQNLTMRVSGAGSLALSNVENMPYGTMKTWTDGSLAPCERNCYSVDSGWPQYYKMLNLTFTVRPIKSRVEGWGVTPTYDALDLLGHIWVHWSIDDSSMSSTQQSIGAPTICGLVYSSMGGCAPPSNESEAGPERPPLPQCTLTVTTPGVVEFQPISSDDLSRNRVRMEDFTLTATKGPVQSQNCVGSTYNLPGIIKTEGGYSISSTFWGINHVSGTPQGIGLKLYDLDKGSYLAFNQTYPAFISNINSVSESKRIRAEIATTTNDLKKIKDGDYSQVLIFEVKMP